MLMQTGQKASLAQTLQSLPLDMCCLSEMITQCSGSTIRSTSSFSPNAKFYLRLSGDPNTAASDQAGVRSDLSLTVEANMSDRGPGNG